VNTWTGTARLGADPETRSTTSGKTVCGLRLAIDDGFGEKKKTVWIDGDAWEKTAEFLTAHFKKGDKILIAAARLAMDEWEKDGQKRTKIKLVVERVEFCDSKRSEPMPTTPGTTAATAPAKDEECPF
jgi:single-strand DNA-binding protein